MDGEDQTYLDRNDLKNRGWTDSLIGKFLGDPDAILPVDHFRNYSGKKAYKLARVQAVEASADFDREFQKSLNRRKKGKKYLKAVLAERASTPLRVAGQKTEKEMLLEMAAAELKSAIERGLRTPHKS